MNHLHPPIIWKPSLKSGNWHGYLQGQLLYWLQLDGLLNQYTVWGPTDNVAHTKVLRSGVRGEDEAKLVAKQHYNAQLSRRMK